MVSLMQSLIVNPFKKPEKPVQDAEKTLYGVMFEVRKKGRWIAREEYLHASDIPEAKWIWGCGIPRGYKLGFNVHLVGIAPVIGVYEDEENEVYLV